MGAVYHIFTPQDGSWKWVATVPAPLNRDDAKRALLIMGVVRRGQPIRMIRIEDSPQPQPPASAPDEDGR
jgi:hypothetical protein